MEILDVFSADKWRALIADFDAKRVQFVNELNSLSGVKAASAALESERQALLKKANPINSQINTLYGALKSVRDWLAAIGGIFGAKQLNGLGIAPIAIGISLGAAALIVNAITTWLRDVAAFKSKNASVAALLKAGASADDITKVLSAGGQSSAKLFGFDVRWVLAIGALFIAGPYVVRGLEKYRIDRLVR